MRGIKAHFRGHALGAHLQQGEPSWPFRYRFEGAFGFFWGESVRVICTGFAFETPILTVPNPAVLTPLLRPYARFERLETPI